MEIVNATKVRNEWSSVSDSVIREKPAFIKKTRDYLFLADIKTVEDFLSAYSFTADVYIEDDGSVTMSLAEMDIAENAPGEIEALEKLARAILEYSEDFYKEYAFWARGRRKAHIPYIIKALIINDAKRLGGMIQCRHGKT